MKNYISRNSLFYYDNINNRLDKIVLYNISYDKRCLKKYIKKYLSCQYYTKLSYNSLKEPFLIRNPYTLFYPKLGIHLSLDKLFILVTYVKDNNKKENIPIYYNYDDCINHKININPILHDKK